MVQHTSTWTGGRRFLHTSASGHVLVTDTPADSGGTGTAPSPMELVLPALAGCAGVDVVGILEKMKQPLSGMEIKIEAERAPEHPRVYTRIHLEFRVSGAVEEDKLKRALDLSLDRYCSVAAMLRAAVPVTFSYVIQE